MLYDVFSEMAQLFVVQEIPVCNMPKKMKIYMEKTSGNSIKGTQKLVGVMKVKKILLYTSLIKWYLKHG